MNVWKILQAKVLTNIVAPATDPSCPGSRTPSWFWYIFCLSRLWGVFEDERRGLKSFEESGYQVLLNTVKKLPAEKLELTAEFKKKGGHVNVSH